MSLFAEIIVAIRKDPAEADRILANYNVSIIFALNFALKNNDFASICTLLDCANPSIFSYPIIESIANKFGPQLFGHAIANIGGQNCERIINAVRRYIPIHDYRKIICDKMAEVILTADTSDDKWPIFLKSIDTLRQCC